MPFYVGKCLRFLPRIPNISDTIYTSTIGRRAKTSHAIMIPVVQQTEIHMGTPTCGGVAWLVLTHVNPGVTWWDPEP